MESELKYKTFSALMHALYAEIAKQKAAAGPRSVHVTGAINDGDVLIQAHVSVQLPPDVFILAGDDLDEQEGGLEA